MQDGCRFRNFITHSDCKAAFHDTCTGTAARHPCSAESVAKAIAAQDKERRRLRHPMLAAQYRPRGRGQDAAKPGRKVYQMF